KRVRDFKKSCARDFGKSALVHPTTLAFAILLVLFIGWTEVAVFVEIVGWILVVLAHVDLEFLSGAAALPAVVTVGDSVGCFRESEQKSPSGHPFYVDPAEKESAQVGDVRGTTAATQ